MWDRTISDEIEIDGYGTCSSCKQQRTYYYWCSTCEFRRYQQAFPTWTSGNKQLDRVILEIQRHAPSIFSFIEWIPYSRFSDIKKIGQGAFSNVYTAIWKDGPRDGPPSFPSDFKVANRPLPTWERRTGSRVALKQLNDSQNIQTEFFNEIKTLYKCAPDGEDFENFSLRNILRCYGISLNPQTGEYIIVMQYAEQGDLEKYLARNNPNDKPWSNCFKSLKQLATGLSVIHSAGLTHRNLHAGNVLHDGKSFYIGDVGLSHPMDPPRSPSKGFYGVMPYVAPEVLLGGAYSQAADIYSFGILAWELVTGQRPFINRAHDPHLHLDIYNGLRPEIGENIPSHLAELIKRCWDPDPSQRPTAYTLEGLLIAQTTVAGSPRQILTPRSVDDMADYFSDKKDPRSHPEAIYTTRFLKFIDPVYSASFGTDSQSTDDAKSFIIHKIKEIKKYQREKRTDIREWKDQDFRMLVDWYYWTGR